MCMCSVLMVREYWNVPSYPYVYCHNTGYLRLSTGKQVQGLSGFSLRGLCRGGYQLCMECKESCSTCWCADDELARTDKTYKSRGWLMFCPTWMLHGMSSWTTTVTHSQGFQKMPRLLRSAYVIGCSHAMHGCLCLTLSCSCLAPRMNCINGTTYSELY